MALKDWELYHKMEHIVSFMNFEKKHRLDVEKNRYGTWEVSGVRGMTKRRFDSKSQALKFAKSYMRTH